MARWRVLLIFQTFNRITQRRFNCLPAYCYQANYNADPDGGYKYPGAYICTVSIMLQPFAHIVPAQGRTDNKGNNHQYQKLFRQVEPQATDACAQYFTDADLFFTLLGRERSKTKQAQALNNDSQYRKWAR